VLAKAASLFAIEGGAEKSLCVIRLKHKMQEAKISPKGQYFDKISIKVKGIVTRHSSKSVEPENGGG
jgi:hypothetical protein